MSIVAKSLPISGDAGRPWALGARGTSLHDKIAVMLVSIVVLSPIPLGGNHPVAWLGWAAVLGAISAYYFIAGGRRKIQHPALILSGTGFALFALWQGMPWPASAGFNLPDGAVSLSRHSVSPNASILAAIRGFSYVLFFGLLAQVSGRSSRVEKISNVLFFAVTAQAFWALLLVVFSKNDVGPYAGMATGSFVNHNSLATYLGMGLILGLSNMSAAKRTDRIILGPCVLMISVALLATQSRMGIAATGIGLLVFFLFGRWRDVIAFAIVGGAVFAMFGRGVLERSFSVGDAAQTRGQLYAQVWDMIRLRPFSGYGADSFELAFQLFHAPPVIADVVWNSTHSSYLTLWVERGFLVGSVPIILGILVSWRLLRRGKSGRMGLCAMTIGAVHSLADFSLEIQANALFLLALVALSLGQKSEIYGTQRKA